MRRPPRNTVSNAPWPVNSAARREGRAPACTGGSVRGGALGGQALAALGATRREDLAATGRGHTGAETVLARAADLGGLIMCVSWQDLCAHVGTVNVRYATSVAKFPAGTPMIAAEKPYIRARYRPLLSIPTHPGHALCAAWVRAVTIDAGRGERGERRSQRCDTRRRSFCLWITGTSRTTTIHNLRQRRRCKGCESWAQTVAVWQGLDRNTHSKSPQETRPAACMLPPQPPAWNTCA